MPLIDGKLAPLELPPKHTRVLFDNSRKWRYRVLEGGRGGGKDWAMAAAAVERAVRRPIRVLCTREVQLTIANSIKQVIEDTIHRLGYSEQFICTEREIRGKNGSSFIFKGLKDQSSTDVKSYEAVDICILGEAQNTTKKSFVDLDPTIRKAGSEIWIQFNPDFEDDFIYDFCVTNPPENLISEHVNYFDNPWCPAELVELAERCKRDDPALYEHIWLGKPRGGGGRVFPMFDKKVHVIEFDRRLLPECDLYMTIDPHRKHYPAIVWTAVTPSGATIDYNIWPRYKDLGMHYSEARNTKTLDFTLKELAAIILANDLTYQYGGNIISRTIDPRFAAENPDFTAELMRHGVLNWTDAPFERIEAQRENLKQRLYYNTDIPLGGINQPDHYVASECDNLIRAFQRHCYMDDKDKEDEEEKDFIDACRYFLSIHNGKPRYLERRTGSSIGQIKSLAQHQLESLPATGYYKPTK